MQGEEGEGSDGSDDDVDQGNVIVRENKSVQK